MAGLDSYCKISCGGTGDENNGPFLLSLREDDAISTLHSYGIHKVPHLGKLYISSFYSIIYFVAYPLAGVYGSSYALSLPLVLLSLPPTLE